MNSLGTDTELNDETALCRAWLTAFICFLAASLVTGGLLALIRAIGHPTIDLSRLEVLFAVPVFTFAPEPVERRQYIAGIVTFPVTLAVAWPLVATMVRRIGRGQLTPLLWTVGSCTILIALGIAGYGIVADPYLVKDISLVAVLVSLAAAATLALFLRSGRPVPKPAGRGVDIAATLLIILVSAYSLFGIGAVTDTPAYNVHFNTVFHAMVQVFNGKELLVDLTSQYGLFPHFLEPLFRVTGLTVLSFTMVMAVLTAVSYGLIYRILKNECGSPLAVVGITAVMYYSCVIMRVDLSDPFFQYNPIRLFFPALTLYLTWRFLKHPARGLYLLQFIACSAAILWNFDTGVVSFLSWVLVLLYLEYQRGTIAGGVRHLLWGTGCCLAVVALFSLYLRMRYGAFPDYSAMLTNQKIFYLSGFMMVPMPLFHPWNLIMLVYMAGLVYAVAGRNLHPASPLPALVFYLSVLGVGLFSYYQGRSVSHCLSLVSYPAFILVPLSAHRLLSRGGGRAGNVAAGAATLMIALCLVALPAFGSVGTRFCSDISTRLKATFDAPPSSVVDDAGFVARYAQPGEEVLILSNLSGIHHLVSATACPVKIPSPTELFLMEEYRKIERYLAANRGGKVFADENFGLQPYSPDVPPPQNRILWDVIAARYVLIDTSPSGKMRLFIPR